MQISENNKKIQVVYDVLNASKLLVFIYSISNASASDIPYALHPRF